MGSPVILLGKGRVSLASREGVLAEPEGGGLDAIEALLAERPRAAVVTSGGDEGFFRASLCLERGVPRVVLRRGALGEAMERELSARARTFGAKLFVHDDEHGYAEVAGGGARLEVAAPDAGTWEEARRASEGDDARAATIGLCAGPSSASAAPLERDEPFAGVDLPENLEEVAFTNGDKPVLYLVVPSRRLDALRARHAGAAIVTLGEGAIDVSGATGERVYGGAGEASAHVFVSRERALAERAASLWEQGSSRNASAIGELLGYPPCCTAAFRSLASRGNNASLVYVTAARTRALSARFSPALNVAVRRVVPFTPCTYGCPRALTLAERVIASLSREGAEALRRALARPVLYLDEARAVVFEGARASSGSLEYAAARFLPAPAPLSPDGETIARRILGALFEGGGKFVITDHTLEVHGASGVRRLGRTSPQLGVLLPFGATRA